MAVKDVNDTVHKVDELLKCWENRLTLNNLRLAERYLKAKVHILVHFRVSLVDEEYVACFQRIHSVSGFHEEGRDFKRIGERLPHLLIHECTNVKAPKVGADCNQQAVFINTVKLVESPERIIPTLVWFDRVDSFYRLWPHTLHLWQLLFFVFLGRVKNGEVDIWKWPWFTGSPNHELIGEMVECTSQVLDDVANDTSNNERRILNCREVIDKLARLRVGLGSDFIGIGIEKGFESDIEVLDMLFGPFNFSPGAEKGVV